MTHSKRRDEILEKGVVIFSWDFELAWGFHDKGELPTRLQENDTRQYINDIIDILESFNVPSTWATVGHLLLEECSRTNGVAHEALPKPADDWYRRDPCSSVDTDPLWYAPDIINRLRNCDSEQEIASHMFSHASTESDPEIVRAELMECQRLAEEGEMVSFVSPRHGAVPEGLLAAAGYSNYRAPNPNPSLGKAINFYTGLSGPDTSLPEKTQHGVWCVPSNAYFFYQPLHHLQRRLPSVKRRWFESGLHQASDRQEVFHIWAHPHNFIGDDHAIKQFRCLVKRIANFRDQGRIDLMTMHGLINAIATEQ